VILLLGSVIFSTASAFTSLYVFGDGVCTTTNNPNPGSQYYGKRYSNGRVWIEVLAQRQGLNYDSNKNWSYFGQDSFNLVTNVSHFVAPPDATNDLFVVWANDADFVEDLGIGTLGPPYTTNGLSTWTNLLNLSLTNHFKAVTNLYAKGVRTLILPNAVDLMEIPEYDQEGLTNSTFIRQRIIAYNSQFTNMLNQARALCPGLTICVPDIFSLLDNVLTNAAYYGLTNALASGQPIDAIEGLANAATNGPGTNYIFWDEFDPTAKMHEVIADYVQQLLSPVQVSQLTAFTGSNLVSIANVPVGLSGFVDGLTNLAATNWATVKSFSSTNVSQSVFVPATGAAEFYQLRFPYAWSWP
jgi:phospholipase/lecithinase/hemolysin